MGTHLNRIRGWVEGHEPSEHEICRGILEKLFTACPRGRESCTKPNIEAYPVSVAEAYDALDIHTKLLFESTVKEATQDLAACRRGLASTASWSMPLSCR